MKKAIISIFNNIQCVAKNHNSLESTYLAKKYDLYYIGKKGRTNKHEPKYLDISEVDLNDFDKIFLMLSTPNFFGGVIGDDVCDKIMKLCNYKNDIGILCNDPRIKPLNAAKAVSDRFQIFDDEDIEKFDNLLARATYLFPGKDLNKFYGDTKYNNFIYFNYFKEIFRNKITEPTLLDNIKQHDVVYYGDRRGSYRETQLKKYMPLSDSNLLIGYRTKINIPFIKKLKHNDLMTKLNQCKVSLVLADKEHENNVVTFRFYETLASNCLAAIPIEYDPNKTLIQDEVLKDKLYVKNSLDVVKLVKEYNVDLVNRQHSEYRRIMNINKNVAI